GRVADDRNGKWTLLERAFGEHPADRRKSGLLTPKTSSIFGISEGTQIGNKALAEGEGFEPSKSRKALNGFRDRPVQPLRHPSAGVAAVPRGGRNLNQAAGRPQAVHARPRDGSCGRPR